MSQKSKDDTTPPLLSPGPTVATSFPDETVDDRKASASNKPSPQHTSPSTTSAADDEEEIISSPLPPSAATAALKLPHEPPPRQIIAVSANKGPAAFFNLARKFLANDETVDLSALEGAIVTAVDAAHLMDRAKMATISRIQTSYVVVESKRRSATHMETSSPTSSTAPAPSSDRHIDALGDVFPSSLHDEMPPPVPDKIPPSLSHSVDAPAHSQPQHSRLEHDQLPTSGFTIMPSPGAQTSPIRPELAESTLRPPTRHISSTGGGTGTGRDQKNERQQRRARIVITLQRTSQYQQWLASNPRQSLANDDSNHDVDDDNGTDVEVEDL